MFREGAPEVKRSCGCFVFLIVIPYSWRSGESLKNSAFIKLVLHLAQTFPNYLVIAFWKFLGKTYFIFHFASCLLILNPHTVHSHTKYQSLAKEFSEIHILYTSILEYFGSLKIGFDLYIMYWRCSRASSKLQTWRFEPQGLLRFRKARGCVAWIMNRKKNSI